MDKSESVQAFLGMCTTIPNLMKICQRVQKLLVGDQNSYVNSQIANNNVGSIDMANHASEGAGFRLVLLVHLYTKFHSFRIVSYRDMGMRLKFSNLIFVILVNVRRIKMKAFKPSQTCVPPY